MVKRRRTVAKSSRRKRFRRGVPRLLSRGSKTELKSIDQTIANNFTIAGTLIFLNQIRLGSDFNQRIGRKISMTSVNLRLSIQQVDITSVQTRLRIMLIYDRQTNGAATAFGDVIAGFTAASAVTNDTWDGVNLNNRERYLVLRDWIKVMAPVTATVPGPPFNPSMYEIQWKSFTKLPKLQTIFSTDAAAITEVQTGALFVLIEATTDNEFSLNGTMRLRFFDD